VPPLWCVTSGGTSSPCFPPLSLQDHDELETAQQHGDRKAEIWHNAEEHRPAAASPALDNSFCMEVSICARAQHIYICIACHNVHSVLKNACTRAIVCVLSEKADRDTHKHTHTHTHTHARTHVHTHTHTAYKCMYVHELSVCLTTVRP